jgi:hypothetical protein
MSNPTIPGIQLSNGATTIVVPPMNLRIYFDESTKDDVELVLQGSKEDPKAFSLAAINVILACARRNHPELSREQLCDVLDSADLAPLVVAVVTKSGFKPQPLGEMQPMAVAGATAANKAVEESPDAA